MAKQKAAEKQVKPLVREVLESRQQNPSYAVNAALGVATTEDVISERAQRTADEIAVIRQKLANSADGHIGAASDIVMRTGVNRRMSDTDFTTFRRSVDRAAREAELDRELRGLEESFRDQINVTGEVNPYGAGSPHSWLGDWMAAHGDNTFTVGQTVADRVLPGHEERLQRLARIQADAVNRNTGYGKAIVQIIGAQYRPDHEQGPEFDGMQKRTRDEIRALTTGGGATASASGGGAAAFIPPPILIPHFVEYRSPAAGVLSQLDDSIPLPAWGLTAYIPNVTGATNIQTDTEGDAPSESDPTMGLLSGPVVQKIGVLTLSQAVANRVGPGITGDQLAFRMLKSQLDAAVDTYAISQILANAQAVTNTGSTFALTNGSTAGVGGFLGDVHKAKNLLTTTAGVRLRATHIFAQDTFVDYLGAWSDAQGRPVFEPHYDGQHLPIKTGGDGTAEAYSGYVVNGCALFADTNIPESSSDVQVVVFRPDTVHQLSGTPVAEFVPQFGAGNLDPIVRLRQYTTTIPRHGTGVAVISGAFYAASQFS